MSIYSDMYTFMVHMHTTVVCVLDLFVMLTHFSLGNNSSVHVSHTHSHMHTTVVLCSGLVCCAD